MCCLISTGCDPDEDVEGGPDAKGNLVKPSLTIPNYPEEKADEEAGAPLLSVSMQQGVGTDEEEEASGRGSEGCVDADPIDHRAAGKAPAPRRTSARANKGLFRIRLPSLRKCL